MGRLRGPGIGTRGYMVGRVGLYETLWASLDAGGAE
jgi:hypothetical protein